MSKDLKELLKGDPETAALMNAITRGERWGNALHRIEEGKKAKETPAEKQAREKKEKAQHAELDRIIKKAAEEAKKVAEKELLKAKEANTAKKIARHVNKKTGTLKHIAKMCKWQCQGEKCWAHNQKLCPYIHKGEPGWNQSMAVKKPKKGGASRRTRKNRKQ